ncbi:hypothetical protein POTOM_010968 [Populus tomentosa]|uniref:Uncharacterized protein n=1 Tax=Populus tomentosa TaxID=118781 RepID=A0A8X8AIS1_POPTO|nr:hypothetical protein POTOM_010968 [Populus tomentosa]
MCNTPSAPLSKEIDIPITFPSSPSKLSKSNGNTRKKMAEVKAAAAAGFDTARAAAQKAKAEFQRVSNRSRTSTRASVQNKL